jgi:sugar lactone lactonase YvrE
MSSSSMIKFESIGSLGSLEYGKSFIDQPRGIAYRPSDSLLFIADSKNERVVAFTEDNKVAKIISNYGTKNGIAIMSNDQVILSDELQVLILNSDLRLTRTIACNDIDAGLTNYQGICVDKNDLIYVCDQANRQVKVYDPKSGNILRFFGTKNLFSSLAYCISSNEHIYVTDPQGKFNQLIVFFSVNIQYY